MAKGELKVWLELEEVELLREFGENPSKVAAEAISMRAAQYSNTIRQERILKYKREIERLERLEVKSARREVAQEEEDRGWLKFVKDFEELARKHDFEPRAFSFWYNTLTKENGFAKRKDELLPIYAKYHPQDAKNHFHYSNEQPIQSEMVEKGAQDIGASKEERPAATGG